MVLKTDTEDWYANSIMIMKPGEFSGILNKGGTILGTSVCRLSGFMSRMKTEGIK